MILAGQARAARAPADHRQVHLVPGLAVEEGPDPPGEIGPLLRVERDHPAVGAEQAGQLLRGYRQRKLHPALLGLRHRGTRREPDLATTAPPGPFGRTVGLTR